MPDAGTATPEDRRAEGGERSQAQRAAGDYLRQLDAGTSVRLALVLAGLGAPERAECTRRLEERVDL